MNNALIVGNGQVGRALKKVLKKAEMINPLQEGWNSKVDVAHIAIPYIDKHQFEYYVKPYLTLADLVIVHSTVAFGTCDRLGIVHSPVRGVHPHLEEGIRTFVKYFGGKRAHDAAQIFKDLGIKTKVYPEARTTEALKLWDTTQYGRLIMLEKEIHAWCKKNKVAFNAVYEEGNKTYNEGFKKLGMSHVIRPILKHVEGEIGGHCVRQNAKLLKVKL